MAINNSLNAPTTTGTVLAGNGTGYSSVTYTPLNTDSTIVSRDANGNSNFVNVIESVTNTVSSGQTISMNYGSTGEQLAIGTSTIKYVLPDSTTLYQNQTYNFNNNSTGNITIYLHDGITLLTTVPSGACVYIINDSNLTSNGTWDYHWLMPSSTSFGNSGLSLQGYLTTSPPSSATATTAWVTSLTAGTAQQNTSGYDMLVTICVTVALSTTATLVMGVGATSTPTTQTVIPSFTVAAATQYTWSAYVPNNYYLLVNSTGTITISSITTMAMGI